MIWKILIVCGIFICCGCNKKKSATRYYSNNKETLISLSDYCSQLYEKYNIERATFRGSPLQVNVSLNTSSDKFTGILFNRNSLTIDTIFYIEPFSNFEKNIIQSISNDSLLLKTISLYQGLKPNALEIQKDGVFLALSGPYESFSHYDAEGGLYLSYTTNFKSHSYIEKIDSFAYLMQSIVP